MQRSKAKKEISLSAIKYMFNSSVSVMKQSGYLPASMAPTYWTQSLLFSGLTGPLRVRNMMLLFLGLSSIACATATPDTWNVTCPSPCSCVIQKTSDIPEIKVAKTVDCTHKKLQEVPSDIPVETEALLLRDNGLSEIVPGTFDDLQDLQLLDLSYNMLSSLGPHPVFGNMTSLKVLNLQRNLLSSLTESPFGGLANLEEIILSENSIKTIEDHAFQGMNRVRTLDLRHNELSDIHPGWFADLLKLQTLYLDHNKLTQLHGGSLLSAGSLTKLSLSYNNLTTISSDSFMGLMSLSRLDLSYNKLTNVPSMAFSVFRRLKLLTLDGNAIRILGPGSFQGLSVYEISLCQMPELLSVDLQTFVNLPQLNTLRLNSNKALVFVHPQALENLPRLEDLYLHDNNIPGLSSELVLSLPSLQQFSFYGNPLLCDCNAYWLKPALTNRTFYPVNNTALEWSPAVDHVTFQRSTNYICDQPPALKSKPLVDLPLAALTATCKPTVISFFQSSYQREIGKSIVYECRAIGVPFPHIHWILSNRKILNNTSNDSRIRVSRAGTLSVSHLKAHDAGTYTCVATSDAGFDTVSTSLQIHSSQIRIINRGSTSNFIHVTWNGTESTIDTSDYMLQYRRAGSAEPYQSLHLRPYMRSYTISDLEPDTGYECCIAYEHSKEVVKLNCLTIRTKDQMYMMHGIRTISKLTILLALCLTSLGVILICVLMVIVRRYQRRKSYQDPGGSMSSTTSSTGLPSTRSKLAQGGRSQGGRGAGSQRCGPPDPVSYKVGQISNIPLDNLYNPPTTPLCTSTTSLISSQSNA